MRLSGGSLTVGAVTTNTTTRLPAALGTLAPGAAQSVVLRFPASAGAAGTSVLLRTPGAYTGGTFTRSGLVRLP